MVCYISRPVLNPLSYQGSLWHLNSMTYVSLLHQKWTKPLILRGNRIKPYHYLLALSLPFSTLTRKPHQSNHLTAHAPPLSPETNLITHHPTLSIKPSQPSQNPQSLLQGSKSNLLFTTRIISIIHVAGHCTQQ